MLQLMYTRSIRIFFYIIIKKIIIHERALSGAIYELPIDLTKDFRFPIYRNNLKEVV